MNWRSSVSSRCVKAALNLRRGTDLLECHGVLLVELESTDERGDLVRLGVRVRCASNSVQRHERQSPRPLSVHHLHKSLGGHIVVDDNVEQTRTKRETRSQPRVDHELEM